MDVTEVPYSLWSNYWNFTPTQVSFYGTIHSDEPLFENRIGIQVYYTVNGVKNASDIVYLEVFPTEDPSAVNELSAGKQVANVRYYNLAGHEVAQPNGLTIQVTTFTDGTRTATKVIK